MSEPDIGKLMSMAKGMQEQMAKAQEELQQRTAEGGAGGGMVTAVVRGDLRVAEVRIEPSLIEGGDRELIQDLVTAAVNAALTNAQSMVQQEMQKASGPMASLFGLGK
ncbi:MAG: YbaB/EbfC family nucleoid-associated protein [Deltaproteobacteria bacterium]|nr:YbaB/EbfC family nucleoid-associated protein [Deltaproteobacteria bacterium]